LSGKAYFLPTRTIPTNDGKRMKADAALVAIQAKKHYQRFIFDLNKINGLRGNGTKLCACEQSKNSLYPA
jgi:hypothetical protein